jgi:hypothetical protein
MNPIRPIILGIAKGGDPDDLKTFVLSLRKTGYTGDVCLFVDDLAPETLRFLHENRVQLQAFPQRYFIQTRRFFLRFVVSLLPKKDRDRAAISFSQYYLKLNDARWACYFDFLSAVRGLYTHVMFTDVKDVFFQRQPFDFDWKSPFCSFYEDPAFLIKDDSHTYGWIRESYGANEAEALKVKRIICSGVTFAEIDAALEYLQVICQHMIRVNARGLVDQGVYNHILHRDLLKSVFIYDQPDTPVMHVGLVTPEKLKLNDEGFVLNGSGKVANVVHQYFKHRKALTRCLDAVTAAG